MALSIPRVTLLAPFLYHLVRSVLVILALFPDSIEEKEGCRYRGFAAVEVKNVCRDHYANPPILAKW